MYIFAISLNGFGGVSEVTNGHYILQVLTRLDMDTAFYSVALFCLMFNIRVLAPATYQDLIWAITYAPMTIGQFIPASLIEVHGFTSTQIIEIAWFYIIQIDTSTESLIDPLSTMSESEDVDMLALLESAAANNSA